MIDRTEAYIDEVARQVKEKIARRCVVLKMPDDMLGITSVSLQTKLKFSCNRASCIPPVRIVAGKKTKKKNKR